MGKVQCACMQCGKAFYTFNCEIKKGRGKFCSRSCATTYRNIHNNPTKDIEVRHKISKNHADVSGTNNPMYNRRGETAPSYIDGRNSFSGDVYRRIMLANVKPICNLCGEADMSKLQVHHIDKNHSNNELSNLVWLCARCHNNIVHKRNRDKYGRFLSDKMGVV